MKASRRILAMLAVIAIAVSGFAFAEERAFEAAFSEIVIEEVAGETIEMTEEPAAEEEGEAPAAEETEAIEEAAKEAVVEEPAGEESEPAPEESDMPETIDVPVVLSLFHRDEVPGNCPHTNEELTGEDRWDKEILATDEKTHTLRYTGDETYYCPDCGYDYYLPIEGYKEVTEEHNWAWDGSSCWDCGYVNSCTHENIIVEHIARIPQQVISYDEKQHTCVFVERTWYYCPDCTENMWEDGAESITDTESHIWWDGRCECCPEINPCTHENQYVEYISSSVVEVISVTKDSHTIEYREEYLYVCPDCQQESWEMQDEILTKTEAHDWYEGECHLCGSVNTCAHKNKAEGHNYWEIVKVLSTTAQKHVAEVRDYTYYDCEDCGESFRELADTTYTRSAAHEWSEIGYCYECNYRNICAHPNSVANSYYDNWGGGKQVDARTHTCSYYYEEYNVCPDCGYRSEIRRNQETRLENHDFNNEGVCRICEYKISCAHKKTHTVDSQRYMGCAVKDSKSHIYTYSTGVATICDDCGAELSRKVSGSEKDEECHFLDEAGICIDCGYESSCSHARTKDESYTDEYVRPYDVNSHIVISEKSEIVICTSCDAFLTNRTVDKITGTKLVKHSFKNGQCTECELYEVECAHEFDKNGKCKLCGKTPGKELESITVDASLTMYVDDKLYLTITLNPSGAEADLEYSSSKSSVVSVDSNGMLTAKKAGEATITVKADNGKSAKCAVTVKASPDSISLSETALSLGEGQKAKLSVSLPKNTAARITWSSSSDTVRVEDGVVTAVKAGTAVVTATTGNGLVSASCTVTVNPAPTAVIAEDVMLVVGQKYTASAKLQAGDVVYEGSCSAKLVSGKGVVTVDEKTGLITAKKAGTAVVTLSAYNGVSADCTITVVAAPKSVKLSASKKNITEGESLELTAKLSPVNAYTDGYTVSMDKDGIVSVEGEDGSFTVTAIAAGKVKLTIAASNGKKATCTITVK